MTVYLGGWLVGERVEGSKTKGGCNPFNSGKLAALRCSRQLLFLVLWPIATHEHEMDYKRHNIALPCCSRIIWTVSAIVVGSVKCCVDVNRLVL